MAEAREYGGWVTYLPNQGTTPVTGRPPATESNNEEPVMRFGTGPDGTTGRRSDQADRCAGVCAMHRLPSIARSG